jgi:hypothetical protein
VLRRPVLAVGEVADQVADAEHALASALVVDEDDVVVDVLRRGGGDPVDGVDHAGLQIEGAWPVGERKINSRSIRSGSVVFCWPMIP